MNSVQLTITGILLDLCAVLEKRGEFLDVVLFNKNKARVIGDFLGLPANEVQKLINQREFSCIPCFGCGECGKDCCSDCAPGLCECDENACKECGLS